MQPSPSFLRGVTTALPRALCLPHQHRQGCTAFEEEACVGPALVSCRGCCCSAGHGCQASSVGVCRSWLRRTGAPQQH